jgi:hypothetical protein
MSKLLSVIRTINLTGFATGFRKVLAFSNPPTLIALQDFNKFIVQHEASLLAYSLDLLARVYQGQAPPETLDASMEKVAGHEGSVLFARSGRIGNRTLRESSLQRVT